MTTIDILQRTPRTQDYWYLGVDAGGTKCRALLVDGSGKVLGEGLGGSANAFVNALGTQASIVQAAEHAVMAAGGDLSDLARLVVSAGIAGVNVPQAAQVMRAWQHPFAAFNMMSDLEAACLGAHAGADGRVIVLGTGSCGAARINGELLLVGGHGLALGDDASGAWLGREAIRWHLLAVDGLIPPTQISACLAQVAKSLWGEAPDDWVGFMQGRSTADYAKCSAAIFKAAQAGDGAALHIIDQSLNYIERLAARLNAHGDIPLPIAFVGGLLPFIGDLLRARLDYAAPLYPPEVGALLSPALTAYAKSTEVIG